MSIATELEALSNYLSSAYDKIEDKNGTIPDNKNMANLADAIDSIQGGGIIIPPEYGDLTGIAFQSLPSKLDYYEGENFNPQGCVVLGTFSGGYIVDVTVDCTFVVPIPLLYNTTNVTVTYETFSLNIPITVTSVPVVAPTTTSHLAHFNGNTLDEVTSGNLISSSYSQITNGKFGTAQTVGNSNNVSFMFNNILFNRTNGLTIEFWGRTSSIGYVAGIIFPEGSSELPLFASNTNPVSSGFTLNYVGSGSMFTSQTIVNKPTSAPATNSWNHYALVFSGNTFKFFFNGTLMTTATIGNWGILGNTFYIKKIQSSGYNANYGVDGIDEFLACNSVKYVDSFIPNHAPYVLPSND